MSDPNQINTNKSYILESGQKEIRKFTSSRYMHFNKTQENLKENKAKVRKEKVS